MTGNQHFSTSKASARWTALSCSTVVHQTESRDYWGVMGWMCCNGYKSVGQISINSKNKPTSKNEQHLKGSHIYRFFSLYLYFSSSVQFFCFLFQSLSLCFSVRSVLALLFAKMWWFVLQRWSQHTDAILSHALSHLLVLTFPLWCIWDGCWVTEAVLLPQRFLGEFQVHGSPVVVNLNYYLWNKTKDLCANVMSCVKWFPFLHTGIKFLNVLTLQLLVI